MFLLATLKKKVSVKTECEEKIGKQLEAYEENHDVNGHLPY
jgi:hypothetical protein